MMKKRGIRASLCSVSAVCGFVESLESRCLLSGISVDPGDAYQTVHEIGHDEFSVQRLIGNIPLTGVISATSEYDYKDNNQPDPSDPESYFHVEEMSLATAHMEMSGSLIGRLSAFSARVDTYLIDSGLQADDAVANDRDHYAKAIFSISGWGHLDVYLQAWTSTLSIFSGMGVSSVSILENGETNIQATEGYYHIKADGKFNVDFSVTARADRMILGANLAPGQTTGIVERSYSGVLLYAQATRYDIRGYSRTDTTQEKMSGEGDYVYSATANNDVYGKGQGVFSSDVYARHENKIGYDGGKTWSNNLQSYVEVSYGIGTRGSATYRLDTDYEGRRYNYPDRTVKFNLSNLRIVDEISNIRVGNYGGLSPLLDQLFADYMYLRMVLSGS